MATEDQIAAGITESYFDSTLFLGKPRETKVTVGREDRIVKVRAQLTIDQLHDFLLMEQAVNEALESEDDSKLIAALDQAADAIHSVIAEFDPSIGRPSLDENQTLGMLAWLAGDVSVAQRLARVLTAGEGTAKAQDAVATPEKAMDEEGFASGGEGGVPLPVIPSSKEPSLTAS